MSATVENARALLAQFEKSPWRDLYVRTGAMAIFMAKPGGGANPMSAAPPAPVAEVVAPHLGLFFATVEAGMAVAAGDIIGRLDVLDEARPVVSTTNGTVAAVLVTEGALVEYGSPLIRIAA